MKRFLLAGHGGFFNRGCEAIVISTVSLLREAFPGCEIRLSSFSAAEDRQRCMVEGIDIVAAQWLSRRLWARLLRKAARTIGYWDIILGPTRDALRWADVVVSIGGDNYTLDYAFPPAYFVHLNHLTKKYGKYLVIWGASIGPFEVNGVLCKPLIEAVELADIITARDYATVEELAEYGIEENVYHVADPAFLLPTADDAPVYEHESGPLVGINISPLVAPLNNEFPENIQGIVMTAQHLIDKLGAKLLLILHVASTGNIPGDEVCLERLSQLIARDGQVQIVPYHLNAMQTKSVISQCDLLLAGRTHATISGFSTAVPTISIAYSRKALGINEYLFGHTDYVIAKQDLANAEVVSRTVSRVLEEGPVIRSYLEGKIPAVKDAARRGAEYLKKSLP